MRKRIVTVFAAAVLALALAGCGGAASSSSEAASSSKAESAASSASSTASSKEASSKAETKASSSESAADDKIEEAFDKLIEANPISNQFEITAMNIEYDFGIKAEDVVSYKGVKSNDNGDAGLVLIIRTPAGKAEDVLDALEVYREDQIAFYGNYSEFAQAQSNVENCFMGYTEGGNGSGGVVILIIPSNECTDTDAIPFAQQNAMDIAMGTN